MGQSIGRFQLEKIRPIERGGAALIAALREQPKGNSLVLERTFAEKRLKDVKSLALPTWNWPER